jgi:hypothetical protein
MPTPTYVSLATITLGSADSEIVFSSIPATYRDLILIIAARSTDSSNSNLTVRYNSDTGSNYSWVRAGSDGSPFSDSATNTYLPVGLGTTSEANGIAIFQIMDYSATDKHKTNLLRDNRGNISYLGMRAGRWANTAAINTITINALAGSIASGAIVSLYGIAS